MATFDRRIAAVKSLARDRFDSDCVLGTQFESSQPTTHSGSNRDFLVLGNWPRISGVLQRVFVSARS
jgi:hypothetical protein